MEQVRGEARGEAREIEYDKCVLCGIETDEPRDKHVNLRHNYIEGAGQLCRQCGSKYNN